MAEPELRTFICSRQVECLMEIKAYNIGGALAQLPETADDLVEQADAVAHGSNWSVQLDGPKNQPQSFDDSDVKEARDGRAADFMPGDD